MSQVCLIHLVWAPDGTGPLERFAGSYLAHGAGADHRLLVVLKNFGGDAGRLADARRTLAGVDHDELVLDERVLDLGAYRMAAAQAAEPVVCMVNSHSVILADGWLGALLGHLEAPGVGLVGATASCESATSEAPRPLKPFKRRHYPAFPNPHIRTNAFMLRREVMLGLDWPPVARKEAAHRLESGTRCITRQVWERGLEALVVGRDGRAYRRDDWGASGTFRSGDQGNLLVADNRTRQFEQADAQTRRLLARMAWGA